MIRIAVVDDDATDAEELSSCIRRFAACRGLGARVDRISSADDLLAGYVPIYDILFLDIEMPGTDGMSAARSIRRKDARTIIVFVTNMSELAIEGYGVDALDFLVKPVDPASVEMVMRRALPRIESRQVGSVTLAMHGGMRVVSHDQLYYVEVRSHYVTYHTASESVTVRGSLAEVERQLEGGPFLRCNRWYIVNVRHVTSVRDGKLTVNGVELEVSRSRRTALLHALAETL